MTIKAVFTVVSLVACTVGANACENPPLVQIPPAADIDAAARERLSAEFQTYYAAVRAYTECIQAEFAAVGGEDSAPLHMKAAYISRNNNAVSEAQTMIQLFNERLASAPAAAPAEAQNDAPEEKERGRRRRRN